MTKTFELKVRRDGKFWFIEIPALDGATQARNLSEIDVMARDYISEVTGLDQASVLLALDIELPAEVEDHLAKAAEARLAEATARSRAAAESRAAAVALKSDGLTVREVGRVLGVSHQRAQQLIHSA